MKEIVNKNFIYKIRPYYITKQKKKIAVMNIKFTKALFIFLRYLSEIDDVIDIV